MALIDFLKNCHCILNGERAAFADVCSMAKVWRDPFVGYMPLLELDLEPIYILECTEARKFTTGHDVHVYIAPLGAKAEYSLPLFSRILEDLYVRDRLPACDGPEWMPVCYETKLAGTILLRSYDVEMRMTVRGVGEISAVGIHFYQEEQPVYLIAIADDSGMVWKNVMEKYSIRANMLIDAHKGLGDWFETTPLYHRFLNSERHDLSPRYYFKGKYISHDAPDGFKLVYQVPAGQVPRMGADDIPREVYITGWGTEK